MATLRDYQDAAPTVMATGELTLAAIENKLSNIPDPPKPPAPPAITKGRVGNIFNAVFAHHSIDRGIEMSGGITKLARANKLKPAQVKKIIRELVAMKAVYDAG